jgi:ATP-dependent RNA helicase DHX37/DHR1
LLFQNTLLNVIP